MNFFLMEYDNQNYFLHDFYLFKPKNPDFSIDSVEFDLLQESDWEPVLQFIIDKLNTYETNQIFGIIYRMFNRISSNKCGYNFLCYSILATTISQNSPYLTSIKTNLLPGHVPIILDILFPKKGYKSLEELVDNSTFLTHLYATLTNPDLLIGSIPFEIKSTKYIIATIIGVYTTQLISKSTYFGAHLAFNFTPYTIVDEIIQPLRFMKHELLTPKYIDINCTFIETAINYSAKSQYDVPTKILAYGYYAEFHDQFMKFSRMFRAIINTGDPGIIIESAAKRLQITPKITNTMLKNYADFISPYLIEHGKWDRFWQSCRSIPIGLLEPLSEQLIFPSQWVIDNDDVLLRLRKKIHDVYHTDCKWLEDFFAGARKVRNQKTYQNAE